MKKFTTIKGFIFAIALSLNLGALAQSAPTTKSSAPTADASDVISLFSNSYTNVGVTTWRTDWSAGVLTDTTIDGSDVKKYSDLTFVGIETTGANQIDASDMVYFNIDVWTPNATQFRVKLVDFGADGEFGGGDDTEHELAFNSPANGEWITYKLPLSDFAGMTSRSNIAQLILAAQPDGAAIIYVDNIYFSQEPAIAEPMEAAPTPTLAADNVISIFSDAYTNVSVNTFRTDWSAANFEEIEIDGNKTLKYSNLDFVGIETTGANTIDASDMEFVHFNVWTPNATLFRFKIVDFGADGEFGGGDDTEHEVIFENPDQEEWITVNLPFSDLTGLENRGNLAQYIFSAQPVGTAILYVDNILFGKEEASVNKVNPLSGSVYPNPTANTLNIDFTSSVKINGYSLISMDGKEVISNEINQSAINTSLDISGLSNGVYMLQIATENGSFSYRVIKQ